MIEIFFEGFASGGGEAVFGAGDASFKKLGAADVVGFLKFAGVDAEIPVSGFEQALEIVEAERIVDGESADNAEAETLVNQAIELRQFGGTSGA